MKMNKVLVRLFVPVFEEQYDVWIPLNRKIYSVTNLLIKAVNDFSGGVYVPTKTPMLYDKITAKPYDINLTVKDAGIKNSTEIILL